MDYYLDTLIDEYGYHRVHRSHCEYLPDGVQILFEVA